MAQTGAPSAPKMSLNLPTNQVTARQDLGDVMRVALGEERKNRDALLAELARTRQTVSERERDIQNFQSQLQSTDQQAARLARAGNQSDGPGRHRPKQHSSP